MPTYGPPSVMFVRGEGCWLWDREDTRYLDFLSGIAVVSLGHAHPKVAEAVAEQARTLCHVSNLYATEPQMHVARTIDRIVGGPPGQVFFANSGAESNECAIKLARKWAGHGRYTVISAGRSFHGRTLATLHATGQAEKHEAFQPLPEGFRHVPWDDLNELEKAIDDTTAAVLLEPIQGEGGINVPSHGYLQAVRELCDDQGLLFMLDEVQTGLARTGRWFAHHHDGVDPDVVTLAKALGNGMPIGACWARAEVAAAFKPGDHATTFGGQPLAASAAKATLEVMQELDLPARAAAAGEKMRSAVEALDGVTSVRGRGLLLGVELAEERPAAEVVTAGMDAGLVLGTAGTTSLRIAPPLIISDEEIAHGVAVLDKVLKS
ncbi:MAG: acetylornithine transaminase [Acidimicrobiia bacterium]|nr:acetylornithine transaminase [Acidimicrobiia bacterium]MXZ79270.1 acetylornithine transaminase [Acidimicrobiia bacterium]MXZ86260.1 acetylornithine transaminase [Acidimicrobiia bacterium]MYB72947.1 acetylornithine transaminase [Acidimicrobiia bacterium]MYE73347.1 acetylornithine transaminase [Acidimicrobiia bacterium]